MEILANAQKEIKGLVSIAPPNFEQWAKKHELPYTKSTDTESPDYYILIKDLPKQSTDKHMKDLISIVKHYPHNKKLNLVVL